MGVISFGMICYESVGNWGIRLFLISWRLIHEWRKVMNDAFVSVNKSVLFHFTTEQEKQENLFSGFSVSDKPSGVING